MRLGDFRCPSEPKADAAFAPTRDVGVLVAINQYDFPLAMGMAETVNELIEQLAPR